MVTYLKECFQDDQSKQVLKAFGATEQSQNPVLDKLLQETQFAFQTEVQSVEGAAAEDFLPAPSHWKQIARMPERQREPWLKSLKAELILLIVKMKVFQIIEQNTKDPIIPTTTKFRTKIKPDGTVEKLKARICLRGDKQEKDEEYDTWCKVGGFNAVKIFLAMAAFHKCRVYQLDYTGAFLQAPATTRVVTILPAEWKEFFPDLAEYFGVPLLILKSLYGQTESMKNFDIRQSNWLVNDYGFQRCPSEESIYHYHHDGHFIYMNNVVDDQLYFSNYDPLRKNFEKRISEEFLVELMGQAHWYLQARIQQHANYSITLDQSRYMALIASRFLPEFPTSNIKSEDKARYISPLPQSFVPTKEQQSKTYSEVRDLEAKYGFQFSSATGMLIFLMNTTITLQYAIRKLARFNQMPGKPHYKAITHLMHHIRTHRTDFGLKFYSPDDSPPVYSLVKQLQPKFDPTDVPILLFTDSSWQDCPDTSRSTGAYILYLFGSLVDGASFVPTPVAMSSAESEYNAHAFALTAAIHLKQIYNDLMGYHPDAPLTFHTFVDSSSAIAMMNSDQVTRKARHIERRIHFVRQARAQGVFIPFKIPGEQNPADVGTKNLPGSTIVTHLPVLHVSVPV